MSPRSPREYGSTKAVATRAVEELGGVANTAFLVSRSPSTVYIWTDPASEALPPYDRVRLMTVSGARAFAADLAALAGASIAFEDDGGESAAALIKRGLQAAASAITAENSACLKRALDEAVSALALARRRLEETS